MYVCVYIYIWTCNYAYMHVWMDLELCMYVCVYGWMDGWYLMGSGPIGAREKNRWPTALLGCGEFCGFDG